MSNRLDFLKNAVQKIRRSADPAFGADLSGASAKPTLRIPTVKTDGLGNKRVIIDDDSEIADIDQSKKADDLGASRFRLRRIAIGRQQGRRRLRWFTIVGIVLAGLVLVLVLLTSPILSVRLVQVDGAVYASPDRIAEIVDSIDGEPILTVDLHRAEKALLDISWIKLARVSMHLPSRVNIEIVERTPVGFFRAVDGFNRVIDSDGRVLDVIEGDPVAYMAILGTGPNLVAGEFVEQPFLGAAQLIKALPTELRERLLTVAVSPEGEVSLDLTNDVQVLFGRPDDFQSKLVGLVNEIKRQGTRRYATIDVSSGQPSVR